MTVLAEDEARKVLNHRGISKTYEFQRYHFEVPLRLALGRVIDFLASTNPRHRHA